MFEPIKVISGQRDEKTQAKLSLYISLLAVSAWFLSSGLLRYVARFFKRHSMLRRLIVLVVILIRFLWFFKCSSGIISGAHLSVVFMLRRDCGWVMNGGWWAASHFFRNLERSLITDNSIIPEIYIQREGDERGELTLTTFSWCVGLCSAVKRIHILYLVRD